MLRKKITVLFLLPVLSLLVTSSCLASDLDGRRNYAIGWQISKPASGFSVKIPIQDDYYIQPIFSITMNDKNSNITGHYAVGVRGIYDLSSQQDFLPYIGVDLGYSEGYQGTSSAAATINQGGTGCEAFFGIEYQKYLVRPALEIGLGSYKRYDGSFWAGVVYNVSLQYYF